MITIAVFMVQQNARAIVSAAGRKTRGRSVRVWLMGSRPATMSQAWSTAMSGLMFQGAGALGYAEGYWALWYAAGDIGGGVVNLSAIGRRMRKLSRLNGSLTPIEYLEKRYPSPAIRLFAASITVFLLGSYALAQSSFPALERPSPGSGNNIPGSEMLFPEPAQLGFGSRTDTLCLELNTQCEEMSDRRTQYVQRDPSSLGAPPQTPKAASVVRRAEA